MPERESRQPHAWQTVQPIWAGPETTWEPPGGGEGAENQSLGWKLLGMLANIQGFTVSLPSKNRCFPLKATQRRRWAVSSKKAGGSAQAENMLRHRDGVWCQLQGPYPHPKLDSDGLGDLSLSLLIHEVATRAGVGQGLANGVFKSNPTCHLLFVQLVS